MDCNCKEVALDIIGHHHHRRQSEKMFTGSMGLERPSRAKLTWIVTFWLVLSDVTLDLLKSRGIQNRPSPLTWKYLLTCEKLLKDFGSGRVEISTPADLLMGVNKL
jgi:hypothetical protein